MRSIWNVPIRLRWSFLWTLIETLGRVWPDWCQALKITDWINYCWNFFYLECITIMHIKLILYPNTTASAIHWCKTCYHGFYSLVGKILFPKLKLIMNRPRATGKSLIKYTMVYKLYTCVEIKGESRLPLRQHKGITVVEVGHRLTPLGQFDLKQTGTEFHVVQCVWLAQRLLISHFIKVEALHENVPHHL